MIWIGEPITSKRASYSVDLGNRPVTGLRVLSSGKGESCTVLRRGMVTEEKLFFHDALMYIQNDFLMPYLSEEKNPSKIDNFIIKINKNCAQVEVNAITKFNISGIVRCEVNKDTEVSWDLFNTFHEVDIPDIQNLDPQTGIIIYFCLGWHRFLFLDIEPLFDQSKNLENLPRNLADGINKKLFPIPTESQINLLEKYNWFPFSILPHSRWYFHLDRIDQGVIWERIEENLLEEITNEHLSTAVNNWRNHPEFSRVHGFAEDALKQYLNKEYSSSISILWPRIEGLLVHKFSVRKEKQILSKFESDILSPLEHLSGFFPLAFKNYLKNVYFKSFEPQNSPSFISRHSLAHGATDYTELNQKNALIGFLILDQIYQLINGLNNISK